MDRRDAIDPYGISKLEAEELVLRCSSESGMTATVLRLPLVYGPGVKANMLRLFALVGRGIPLPFGRVNNRRSLASYRHRVSRQLSAHG